jgi:hypothetical protein
MVLQDMERLSDVVKVGHLSSSVRKLSRLSTWGPEEKGDDEGLGAVTTEGSSRWA